MESNYNTAKKLEEKPEPFKEPLKLRIKDNDETMSQLLSEMSETASKDIKLGGLKFGISSRKAKERKNCYNSAFFAKGQRKTNRDVCFPFK